MTKEKFISISLHQEMQRSYLEYAMSVIVGRALPDARDGMKPVQRRILFAMHELGLNPDRPFRKCARVVGDVLGKYHPHGDQAVYDALVRLVQNFSTKYPTLNGHGNFGSVDDDPPAAMRYTETRLAPIAHEALLQEIESNTVSYSDNFDGSQKEPDVLPAQLPFLFLNGSSGIAVGMATNIPPHNLGEIVDALIALIENNSITDNDLTEIVLGPDFPTGGELIYSNDIKDVYQKGRGSITIRGIINVEEIHIGKGKHKRKALIVTELPYQISKAGWIEKLAEQVNNGKINGIGDIRDESDRDGMRIVIELKRDVNHDLVISELFKKTSLQANFGAIFLALIDGKPMQLSLKTYLQNFLEFRESTIQKRTAYFLNITKDKLEILEGFTLAVENIKKIIEIVQNSLDTNEAKSILSKILNLTNKQADAVLGMPIKKLTNLERIQIKKDIDSLKEKKNSLEKILNQRELLLKMLKEELINLKKKYNTKRKTKIRKDLSLDNQGKEINKQILDELINKETKLSIDNTLQIKKLSLNNYKKFNENNNKIVQKKYTDQFITNIQYELKIIALTSEGKLINIKWDKLLKNDYKLERKDLNNINPYEIINFHGFNNDREVNLCLICNDGRFKKVLLDSEMKKSNRAFSIINPKKKNIIINSFISEENEKIIIITSIGRLFKFNLSNKYICTSSKQAQGSILSKLFPQETIISCCKCKEEEEELIIATKTGDFFNIKKEEIFNSHNSRLGFIDEKIQIKKNEFLSIFPKSKFCSIITNKNRVAKLDFSKINLITNKKKYNVEFLSMEPNEYIEKIFILENLTA